MGFRLDKQVRALNSNEERLIYQRLQKKFHVKHVTKYIQFLDNYAYDILELLTLFSHYLSFLH